MLEVIVNYTNGTKTKHPFSDVFAAHRYATTMRVLEWVDHTEINANGHIIASYKKEL